MSLTNTLTVNHFGPIKEASVTFSRFVVFVGPQGSGKSTLAKLYSMFMWLEKRLIRGMVSTAHIEARFKKTYCGYHRLTSYFNDDSRIEFSGQAYDFVFSDDRLSVSKKADADESCDVAKVMYIPSERNFLSSLGNLSGLKSLPESLNTFKEEYSAASEAYPKGYPLPIGNVTFEYDRLNRISWLRGADYRVRLSDASSGFQAVLPMILVSQYLTDLVASRHEGENNGLSIEERDKLNREVRAVVGNPDLSPEVRAAALAALSSRFVYSGFVNVVEEPEENLYPDSQKSVLYSLLGFANREKGNQLVLTTHSPYIINYMTLAIKAGELIRRGGDRDMVDSVVPVRSCLDSEEVSIYQLSDGIATRLAMPNGLPTDNNFLNQALSETNDLFSSLIDIEDTL